MRDNIRKSGLILCIAFLCGALSGYWWGKGSLKSTASGKISVSSVLFMPPGDYIRAVKHINSHVFTERITGYYMLSGLNFVDDSFLADLYIKENSKTARKILIWLAEQLDDKNSIARFYRLVYKSSSRPVRQLILHNIRISRDESLLRLIDEFKKNGE